eukprot:CAMPEP_0175950656 /NCGR_PEP_ID=MMETSP0108-20121206/29743_1 /TAXON_ID=195067 ORGANISM="Goniomonas pacifica, Strain CCMP1869" /NCGR_SAMPLE_ID=MMETSP0108 /ASSEMBLY_ACC=CAM_ASM_000204 /LENGTH=494 /DNA_ID=CAMNT_0017276783 /DNA_START=54 /DNA_END=1538 /DNA_ORIENTATION=-
MPYFLKRVLDAQMPISRVALVPIEARNYDIRQAFADTSRGGIREGQAPEEIAEQDLVQVMTRLSQGTRLCEQAAMSDNSKVRMVRQARKRQRYQEADKPLGLTERLTMHRPGSSATATLPKPTAADKEDAEDEDGVAQAPCEQGDTSFANLADALSEADLLQGLQSETAGMEIEQLLTDGNDVVATASGYDSAAAESEAELEAARAAPRKVKSDKFSCVVLLLSCYTDVAPIRLPGDWEVTIQHKRKAMQVKGIGGPGGGKGLIVRLSDVVAASWTVDGAEHGAPPALVLDLAMPPAQLEYVLAGDRGRKKAGWTAAPEDRFDGVLRSRPRIAIGFREAAVAETSLKMLRLLYPRLGQLLADKPQRFPAPYDEAVARRQRTRDSKGYHGIIKAIDDDDVAGLLAELRRRKQRHLRGNFHRDCYFCGKTFVGPEWVAHIDTCTYVGTWELCDGACCRPCQPPAHHGTLLNRHECMHGVGRHRVPCNKHAHAGANG